MLSVTILFALVATTTGFIPSTNVLPTPPTKLSAMSQSVPFLLAPKNTKGWVGDVEFDPFGFSDIFEMKWLREAEIKHGRVAMMAALGFWQQEHLTLPGLTPVPSSIDAPGVVGLGVMMQFIVMVGIWEFWTNDGNVTIETMFKDPNRVPGDIGFDPMGFATGKTDAEKERMQLREIKNGRLAMLAIGGMIHQEWVTGHAIF